jgi:DNA-binding CsgD family transcriptional regulator
MAGQTSATEDVEPRGGVLLGRDHELETLDGLLAAIRAGQSRTLVLRGEPGVGKSALLEHLVERASGCRVVHASGVQSEAELAFGGLQQLCGPLLEDLARLPPPQQSALRTAFGLSAGAPPDRLLVGLSALSLLSEAAAERPLVCVIDDTQWLDSASAQALAFVARRLLAESVALVFAARDAGAEDELAELPALRIDGLRAADARTLLDRVIVGPLDERVRDRIVAETRGNPLALLELPSGRTPAELAGGFALPDAIPLSGHIEATFRRRLGALPPATRRLLLVAAAEPSGDPALILRAAERLGVGPDAAMPAHDAGLLQTGAHVQLRHPLVRSAVYRAGTPEERRSVHQALAEATDPEVDPDRRAWHRAQSTSVPDAEIAAELERSARRAQARGGYAAAAAFLERTAALTIDPERRAERALAAAEAKHRAGAPDAALELLETAEAGASNELQHARVDRLHGQIAYVLSRGRAAPELLVRAAKRLEPLDAGLARATYRDAFTAAWYAGGLAGPHGLAEVARAARAAPGSAAPAPASDLLLDGVALLTSDGYVVGAPIVQRALREFRSAPSPGDDAISWLGFACRAAHDIFDDGSFEVLAARFVEVVRDAGALSSLPFALSIRAVAHVFLGQFAAAAAVIAQLQTVVTAMGNERSPYADIALAGMQGRESGVLALMDGVDADAKARGEGQWFAVAAWARAILYNGHGQYEAALTAAEAVVSDPLEITVTNWALPELIEAATRSDHPERAHGALRQLEERARAAGNDWGLGLHALARALMSDGEVAERAYREALQRLRRTRVKIYEARAHLLYGEWLRRRRRRVDAREQLQSAHELFATIGMEAFAQRAARELLVTGVTARTRTAETRDALTPQEAQIARLAGEGFSNPEIGSKLFISPRTVQYHLHKAFAKLDVNSRSELAAVLDASLASP